MRLQIWFLFPILTIEVQSKHAPRKYVPSEENPDRIEFVSWQDEKGNVHTEDLEKDKLVPITPVSTSLDSYRLLLFTLENPTIHEEISTTNASLLRYSAYFDSSRPNFFLIHGWRSDNGTRFNTILRNALLTTYNVNVFIVDWGIQAKQLYTQSIAAINSIGPLLGRYIQELIDNFNLTSHDVVLYGYSLGAHLAGKVGASMQTKPAYIMGLDPAGPLFTVHDTENRIDPTDAKYVQIIHTNGFFNGFQSALGDADFYVNGGRRQPGCGMDVTNLCAHTRAIDYLAASLKNCYYFARKCDSYKNYISENCVNNRLSYMGCIYPDINARGDFYIRTNSRSPFFRDNIAQGL